MSLQGVSSIHLTPSQSRVVGFRLGRHSAMIARWLFREFPVRIIRSVRTTRNIAASTPSFIDRPIHTDGISDTGVISASISQLPSGLPFVRSEMEKSSRLVGKMDGETMSPSNIASPMGNTSTQTMPISPKSPFPSDQSKQAI